MFRGPPPEAMASVMRIFQKEKEEHKELAEKEMGLMHKLMNQLRLSPLEQPPEQADDETIKSRVQTMESILQSDKDAMTFAEREEAAFDVHGMRISSRSAEEGPSMAEQGKLVDLDNELIQLGVDRGRINPLIQDRDYRLMFLRCDKLDVKVAAQRIKKNLEVKRELFGEDCLNREISYSDLTKEDLEALNSGFSMVSKHKDAAGRTVVFMRPQMKLEHLPTRAYHRSQFYYMNEVSKSYSCQKHGLVLVVLNVGPPHGPNGRLLKDRHRLTPARLLELRNVRAAIPKKLAAFHFCLANDNGGANRLNPKASNLRRMFFNAIQLMMPADARNRFRKHCGSKERIEFELGAFGITIEPDDWPNLQEDTAATPDGTIPIDVDPTPLAEMTDETSMIDPASLADIADMMDTDLDPIPLLAMDHTRGVSIGSSETSTSSAHGMDAKLPSVSNSALEGSIHVTTSTTDMDPIPLVAMDSARGISIGGSDGSTTNVTPEPSDSSNPARMPRSSTTSNGNSIVPTDEDVLFGRGRKTMNHPGNLHLRELVNLHRDDYENANKQKKTFIAQHIADTILQSNRRFLKYIPEEDRWVHADIQTARNKISHIYRNNRNKKKAPAK